MTQFSKFDKNDSIFDIWQKMTQFWKFDQKMTRVCQNEFPCCPSFVFK